MWKITFGNQLCQGVIHILLRCSHLSVLDFKVRIAEMCLPPKPLSCKRSRCLERSKSQPGSYFSRDLTNLRAGMCHAAVPQGFVMALVCAGKSPLSLAILKRFFKVRDTPWKGGCEEAAHLYLCNFFISRADMSEASCVSIS